MNIYTHRGEIAFTPENLPGTGQEDATDEQMAAHAERMNAKAKALNINTRYEVR